MPKHRSPDERRRLDPDDVLAGRVKVDAAELLELIHRINPTGRELRAREAELRYALKSRLQSLLVRRFGPELEVAADPEQEGTVSILHRGHGRDACHAVLDALDEDARAWVRLQIDLGPPSSTDAPSPVIPAARPSGKRRPPPDEEGPPSDDASPDTLLRRAEESVAAYDYERAREHLERALAASGGAPEPAAALLALLVDTLGDDAGALELCDALGFARAPKILARPDVRGLLALAEARSGDAEQALSWLRGASDAKGAEAFAALAARAVAAGDAERAAAHVAEIRRRAPAHPSAVSLSSEIAGLRAAARGPLEAELASLVAAGHEDEAEKKAAELLARWPDSEAARRVVRAAEDRRRLAHEAAERRAREAEAALAAEREAARAEEVRARLGDPSPREGLLAWLELGAAQRRRVDAPGAAELLRWLEQTAARAAPAARVDAVLALAEARRRAHDDPQVALDAMEAHEGALERVPEARRLAQEAHAALRARRADRAREEVRAARRALEAGDAAGARRRFEALAFRDLGEGTERAEAEALRDEAARIVEAEKRVGEVGRLRQAGQLFEARALAEALAAESEGEERRRWEDERRSIQEAIHRAFCVEIDATPRPAGEDETPEGFTTAMVPPTWLTRDGRTLALARGRGAWVRIRLVDVGAATIRAEIVLRTPEPVGNLFLDVLGQVAWLAGQDGALLAFDVDRLEIELFRPARELLPAGMHTGQAALVAVEGARLPRFYWSVPSDAEGYARAGVQVIDLEQRRVVRELPVAVRLNAVPDARGGRLACFRANGVALYEDRGAPAPGGRVRIRGFGILCAVVHPSGEGLVVAGTIDESDGTIRAISLVDAPREGPPHAPWHVPGTRGLTLTGLVTCLETGLVTVIGLGVEPGYTFVVVRPTGGAFEIVHRQDGRDSATFVTDAEARHVLAYLDHPWLLAPVGPDMPEMPAYERHPSPWVDDVIDTPKCVESSGPFTDVDTEHRAAMDRADDAARLGRWDEVGAALASSTAASFARDEVHLMHYHHLLALVALHRGDVQAVREQLAEAAEHGGSCDLSALSALIVPEGARDDEVPEKLLPLVRLVRTLRHADARLDAGAPEDVLLALDPQRFLHADEVVQVLARRAEAWLRVSPASRPQRFTKIMALAAFVEAHAGPPWARGKELPILDATWDRTRLDDLAKRASAWLDTQAER